MRVVIYFAENYNSSKMKILKLKDNYFVTFNNQICSDTNYMKTVFRDDKFENTDYFSFISMTSQTFPSSDNKSLNNIEKSEKVLNQIKQAFENPNANAKQSSYQKNNSKQIQKVFNLKTKYYLNNVSNNEYGILINGYGNFSIEKPVKYTSPERFVFDMPNTMTSSNIRNKTLNYNNDTVRIGQFEANKSRMVITTEDANKFLPIFSLDNQSVLIANKEKLNHAKLVDTKTNLINTKYTKTDNQNYGLNFYFDKPVIYSIKRAEKNITIYFFNEMQFNEDNFKSSIKNSEMNLSKIELMPEIGLRYSLSLDANDKIKVYAGADSRTIKLAIQSPNKKISNKSQTPEKTQEPVITIPPSNYESTRPVQNENPVTKDINPNEKVVVIDPGHGGVDCGATRAGIYEKDITTDVSKRVAALLRSSGYKVYMTRDEDKTVELKERVDFTESVAPDLFVSIHVNSSEGTTATGIETHYYHDYSIDLAKDVHNSMVKYISSKDRGLFKSKFYVINHTTMPAILVEIGFISNEAERTDLVKEKRKQATAKAIAEGIMNYYEHQQKK